MASSALRRVSLACSCAGLISRLAFESGGQAGVDVGKLLKRSGLTAEQIHNKDSRLTVQRQIEFVGLVADAIGDNNFGFHLAQNCDLRDLGFLYYIAASADTLGDGLERVKRYSVIANEGILVKITRGKSVRISFQYIGVPRYTDRHQIEFFITALLRNSRHLTNHKIHPLRVCVAHARNDKNNEFKTFAGCKIEQACREDMIELRASNWNLPVFNPDPYLHRSLMQFCEEILVHRKLPAASFRVRVENTISGLLPHAQASMKTVAVKLGVSPRTLGRQLSAERLTFAGILRELRAVLANHYLADREIRISHIAWLLGYKDIGAFTHAYRRWTGNSPSKARARLLHRLAAG